MSPGLITIVYEMGSADWDLTEALNQMNPGVRIGEEGVQSVLSTLHAIRERALSEPPSSLTPHPIANRMANNSSLFQRAVRAFILCTTN